MSKALVDTSTIPGWGVDADPENNPTYPMRHIEDQERGLDWPRPAQQKPDVEVLRSIEHNRLPAVVGTSTPPSGLSGMIRRYAFKRSESDWWHWLLLMGADRIGVVEGVLEDLAHGKVPNVPAEMGARAEWRHNKKGFAIKTGAMLGIGALVVVALRERRTRPAGSARKIVGQPVIETVPPPQRSAVAGAGEALAGRESPVAPIVATPTGAPDA
jgi:hypothetical protein